MIDALKQRSIPPSDAASRLTRVHDRETFAQIYGSYEAEMRRINALDFNSLLYEAHQLLVRCPAIAASYCRTHPYWLIDEFQDTNRAQYRLLQALAGSEFKDVMAVADDDQILYHWNGASFQQIQSFNADFRADVVQLPTNYRCPPAIVEAANRLVVYNAQRSPDKQPLIAAKTEFKYPRAQHLNVRSFPDDGVEAESVARAIKARGTSTWGETAVLARNKALLERVRDALAKESIPSFVAQRRDEFVSAECSWLHAVLKQLVRPADRRNMSVVIESFNRMAGCELPPEQLLSESDVTGRTLLGEWLQAVPRSELDPWFIAVVEQAERLSTCPTEYRAIAETLLDHFGQRRQMSADLDEDVTAWREIVRDITMHLGRTASLDQVLQELQLRSKEPAPKIGTVTLMTIHGAKGREFDIVHVIGMAEEIIPSFQSLKKGNGSPEMEEERRNCFVAITRTKECLVLSHAARYGSWQRRPSRFLIEMGLAE